MTQATQTRVSNFMRQVQDTICQTITALDGTEFHEDSWERPEGGGGRSRVLTEGTIFERAGVGFSAVFGPQLPPSIIENKPGAAGQPFFATGASLVFHPRNPHIPTVHFNYRYFETETTWWFGGGSDLTPYYPRREDVVHFHQTLKNVCDVYDPEFYARFKPWCDEYFYIKHRDEPRGVGGIFFDYQTGDWEKTFAFAQASANSFLTSYLPIVKRRMDDPWTPEERDFQLYRRGRYVEFNLVQDRGTIFGLQTRGRTESILMSMPPLVRWVYDWHPTPGTPEAELYEVYLKPTDWLAGVQS